MRVILGKCFRVLAILLFCLMITPSFAYRGDSVYSLAVAVFILVFVNIAQILAPISILKNVFLYGALIGYYIFISLWASDFGFQKDFEFRNETLSYKYSFFNGTYHKLFGKNSDKNALSFNENLKQQAIGIHLFTECELYEREKNYSDKQKEAMINTIEALHNREKYTSGYLKNMIETEVAKTPLYFEDYKYLAKTDKVFIDSVYKYRHEIFNIFYEE
ncbi:hypothetical protein [Flavobacterium pedocola]